MLGTASGNGRERRARADVQGAGRSAGHGARSTDQGRHSLGSRRECRERQARLWQWHGVAATISAGGALNSLPFEADVATALRLFGQTLDAFKAAGYVLGQALATGNLGASYADLGLYRRARRLTLEAAEISRRAGAMAPLLVATWNLAEYAVPTAARSTTPALSSPSALAHAHAARQALLSVSSDSGRLARDARRPSGPAARHFEQGGGAIARGHDAGASADRSRARTSRRRESRGGPCLDAPRRAHASRNRPRSARLDQPCRVWWRHSQAFAPAARPSRRRKALEQARHLLLARIASLSDEGLRRNYLNKRQENREIVLAWLAHARSASCRASSAKRTSPARVSLASAFERLVDTGLRLNEIKSEAELHEFLVDEVTELSGAERVLLVLEARTSATRLPSPARWCRPARTSSALLEPLTPWLAEARRNRGGEPAPHARRRADDSRSAAASSCR